MLWRRIRSRGTSNTSQEFLYSDGFASVTLELPFCAEPDEKTSGWDQKSVSQLLDSGKATILTLSAVSFFLALSSQGNIMSCSNKMLSFFVNERQRIKKGNKIVRMGTSPFVFRIGGDKCLFLGNTILKFENPLGEWNGKLTTRVWDRVPSQGRLALRGESRYLSQV